MTFSLYNYTNNQYNYTNNQHTGGISKLSAMTFSWKHIMCNIALYAKPRWIDMYEVLASPYTHTLSLSVSLSLSPSLSLSHTDCTE